MLFSNFLQNYEKDNSINKKNKNFPSFRLKQTFLTSFRLEQSGMEKSPTNELQQINCRRFLDFTPFRSK